jgi:hypothetical protein
MTLRGHLTGITTVRFSRDARHLASADNQNHVKLWQID